MRILVDNAGQLIPWELSSEMLDQLVTEFPFKQGWESDIFYTDPDPAQLKKKFRIRLRIRPEIEMKQKIFLYFR